jgi:glycosyltransferase involved in cell wall biosynthesis
VSRLLIFNLATDADDPLLAFTTAWVNRIAAHYDVVDVITMRAGRVAVAANVRVFSVGKERGFSEGRRAAEFYRLLRARLAEGRYDACFAHMMPLFAVMGAPLLAAARVPVTLWYTHRSPHWSVRAAVPLVHRVVTAAPDSFPLSTPKLRVIGHGIDTDFFSPAGLDPQPPHNSNLTPQPPHCSNLTRGLFNCNLTPQPPHRSNLTPQPPHNSNHTPQPPLQSGEGEQSTQVTSQPAPGWRGAGGEVAVEGAGGEVWLAGADASPAQHSALGTQHASLRVRATIIHVARLMPIKQQASLIRALAELSGAQAVFVGEVPPGHDQGYLHSLQELAADLGVDRRVIFAGALPPAGVRDAYRGAFAAVNLSPPGLFDKAALEAMACAVPTLVSNPAFDPLLAEDAPALRVAREDDVTGLAQRIRGLLALPPEERAALGLRLRARVAAAHGLDALIPRLVRVLQTGEPL